LPHILGLILLYTLNVGIELKIFEPRLYVDGNTQGRPNLSPLSKTRHIPDDRKKVGSLWNRVSEQNAMPYMTRKYRTVVRP